MYMFSNLLNLKTRVYKSLLENGYKNVVFCGDNVCKNIYTSCWTDYQIMLLTTVDIKQKTEVTIMQFNA